MDNISKNINTAFNTMGTSVANFIKNIPNKFKDVKTYKSSAPTIKGIKTQRTLRANYLDSLGKAVQHILDDDTINKVKRYKDQDRLMKNSLSPILIKLTLDQCFSTGTTDDYMAVEVVENSSAIREALEEIPTAFLDRTRLKQILEDNLFTFLKYGELFLYKTKNEEGFVTRLEVLEGQYIYPIYDAGEILYYLDLTPSKDEYISLIEPADIAAFFLRGSILPIVNSTSDIENFVASLPDEVKEKFPDTYKVGEPLLYDARKSLKRLTMIEFLADINSFKNLNTPSLATVGVGKIKDEKQIDELLDYYEQFLTDNSTLSVLSGLEDANTEDIDYSQFANVTTKLIPVEDSGKNAITPIDLFSQTTALEERAEKCKKDALQLAGYPASLLENLAATEAKNDLQINKRYRNNCLRVQKALAEPCKDLLIEDGNLYELEGFEFTKETFNITFKNIVNLDGIEDLEIQIATITQISTIYDTIKRVSDSSEHIKLDESGMLAYIEDNLKQFKSSQNLLKWVEGEVKESIDDVPSDTFIPEEDFDEADFGVLDTPVAEEAVSDEE